MLWLPKAATVAAQEGEIRRHCDEFFDLATNVATWRIVIGIARLEFAATGVRFLRYEPARSITRTGSLARV